MKRYIFTSLSVLVLGAGLAFVIKHESGDAASDCVALAKLAARYHPSQPPGDNPMGSEKRAFQLCVADPVAFKRLFHRAA
ncbi:MAG: hypothetical protein IV101_21630 [Dechloromonas sp.]|uniref:hypothetical protein n=1 Tax=Ferribacterium limneticum TaxID=76259 RepID=UPI001CF7FDFB|nr:hypothetical protein [Ferribacterium limneticum]MBT9523484.1 hypothetical protein [Dechloromonas sp.]UCV22833.1 hypothetical protein KI613_20360 [Ferribacterium limneticum]